MVTEVSSSCSARISAFPSPEAAPELLSQPPNTCQALEISSSFGRTIAQPLLGMQPYSAHAGSVSPWSASTDSSQSTGALVASGKQLIPSPFSFKRINNASEAK